MNRYAFTIVLPCLLGACLLVGPGFPGTQANADCGKCEKCPRCPNCECWIPLFDGKTLGDWRPNEHPEDWTVEDGNLEVRRLPDGD